MSPALRRSSSVVGYELAMMRSQWCDPRSQFHCEMGASRRHWRRQREKGAARSWIKKSVLRTMLRLVKVQDKFNKRAVAKQLQCEKSKVGQSLQFKLANVAILYAILFRCIQKSGQNVQMELN